MARDERSDAGDVDPLVSAERPGSADAVAEREWKASTTAFERVEAVLRRTTEWESAAAVADRALVSEPTARKHLSALVESGYASAIETGSATRYRRNPDQRRLERVQRLADEYSRDELATSIREMKRRIRDFEGRYDATSPEELVATLAPDDDEGWEAVSRWQTTRRNLAFAKTALSFTETRRVDELNTGGAAAGENA